MLQFFWIATDQNEPDTYVAFRGSFALTDPQVVTLKLIGGGWYCVWLDGEYLTEGPLRFAHAFPEYQQLSLTLQAGPHVLAIKATHLGATTRMLEDLPPFIGIEAVGNGNAVLDIAWRGIVFPGHLRTGRRINGQLGWMEYLDKGAALRRWKGTDYADADWLPVTATAPPIGHVLPPTLGEVTTFPVEARCIASDGLAERFGYRHDDPPTQFFLRELEPRQNPAQGWWRRYDLGRVRLAKPDIEIEAPAGVVIEFAWSEYLTDGRVAPWITLSIGQSCNMDAFITREGRQTICPLQPKGGRFIEMHVLGPGSEQVKILAERMLERAYYPPTEAGFECADPLLNKIWTVGVETFRACAEDALVDNPTRERGQWTGDVTTVGMAISSVAFSDMHLIRRGLVQSAQCARTDGLVAGMSPGGVIYFASYSAQWINACLHYYDYTGESALLHDMWPSAERNMAAFEQHRNASGIGDEIGPVFIDWGYQRNAGPADLAFNLHYLAALRAAADWAGIIGQVERAQAYEQLHTRQKNALLPLLPGETADENTWRALGFHSSVLAYMNGLVPANATTAMLASLKAHMLDCFPNNPGAPRLANPEVAQPRLITPYFMHYALPVLIENGEMDFVLEQYRRCWGWALEDDRTTWLEVFDTRWSHCHQWSGCPTWQLSRYALGLHPRYELGLRTFELKLHPGSLGEARGKLPLIGEQGMLEIEWQRRQGTIQFHIAAAAPITLLIPHADQPPRKLEQVTDLTLELDGTLK